MEINCIYIYIQTLEISFVLKYSEQYDSSLRLHGDIISSKSSGELVGLGLKEFALFILVPCVRS